MTTYNVTKNEEKENSSSLSETQYLHSCNPFLFYWHVCLSLNDFCCYQSSMNDRYYVILKNGKLNF